MEVVGDVLIVAGHESIRPAGADQKRWENPFLLWSRPEALTDLELLEFLLAIAPCAIATGGQRVDLVATLDEFSCITGAHEDFRAFGLRLTPRLGRLASVRIWAGRLPVAYVRQAEDLICFEAAGKVGYQIYLAPPAVADEVSLPPSCGRAAFRRLRRVA